MIQRKVVLRGILDLSGAETPPPIRRKVSTGAMVKANTHSDKLAIYVYPHNTPEYDYHKQIIMIAAWLTQLILVVQNFQIKLFQFARKLERKL